MSSAAGVASPRQHFIQHAREDVQDFFIDAKDCTLRYTKIAGTKSAHLVVETTKHVADSLVRGGKILATEASAQRSTLKFLKFICSATGNEMLRPVGTTLGLADSIIKLLASGEIFGKVKHYDYKHMPILPLVDIAFDAFNFVTAPIALLEKLKIISLGRFSTPFSLITTGVDIAEQTYTLSKLYFKVISFTNGDGIRTFNQLVKKEKEHVVKVKELEARLEELKIAHAEKVNAAEDDDSTEVSNSDDETQFSESTEVRACKDEIKYHKTQQTKWRTRKINFTMKGLSACLKVALCVSLIALFVVLGLSAIGATAIIPGVNMLTTMLVIGGAASCIGLALLILKIVTPDAKPRATKPNFAW